MTQSESGTKICPFCAEPIQQQAIKCRYCGEFLDPEVGAAQQQALRGDKAPRWAVVFLSFLLPGLGQMVDGRFGAGIVWLLFTVLGYFLFLLPGLFLHFLCLLDAASSRPATV